MKAAQKLLSGFLAIGLCTGLAACHTGQDTMWIAKAGEDTVPAGVYLYFMQDAYYNVTGELTGEDGEKPENPLKEQIDSVPVPQMITEKARGELNEYLAVEQKCKELGVVLSEEDEAQTDSMTEMYWEYIREMYESNGISKNSYRMAVANITKRAELFEAIYGKDGTDPVPESELKDKYNKDVAKIILITRNLSFDSDEAVKEEENKKAKDAINQYYKELEDGIAMEEVYYQALRENAEDPDSVEKPEAGASYTFVLRDTSGLEEPLLEAIFAAEIGKPVKTETENASYLFVRYDANSDPKDFEAQREPLTRQLRQDTFNEQITEWGNSLAAQWNEKALQRYTPEKLKLS